MKGLQITVPVGTDDGTITNVFVKILWASVYTSQQGGTMQRIDLRVRTYANEASYDTDPSNTVMIRFLPPVTPIPGFIVTDINNRANVESFIYGRLKNRIENKTGAGTVIDIP